MTDKSSDVYPCSLSDWQARIGPWAVRTFGPSAPDVHAARLMAEAVDVLDCVAIGDIDQLDRGLSGVMVVVLAMAQAHDINLDQALVAEQSENEAAEWDRTPWGHWRRIGTGRVPDTQITHRLAELYKRGHFSKVEAIDLLRGQGGSYKTAVQFLIDCGADPSDFVADSPADLTPAELEAHRAQKAEARAKAVSPVVLPWSLMSPSIVVGDCPSLSDTAWVRKDIVRELGDDDGV